MKKQTMPAESAATVTFETLESFARELDQKMLQSVLDEEVTSFLGRMKSARKASVDASAGYRNGRGKPRRLALTCGTVTVRLPRVRGLEDRFESNRSRWRKLLPPPPPSPSAEENAPEDSGAGGVVGLTPPAVEAASAATAAMTGDAQKTSRPRSTRCLVPAAPRVPSRGQGSSRCRWWCWRS